MAQITVNDVARYTPDILTEVLRRLGYANIIHRIDVDKNVVRRTYIIAACVKARPQDPTYSWIVQVEVSYEWMEDIARDSLRHGVSNYSMYETIAEQMGREIDEAQLNEMTQEHNSLLVRRVPIGQGVRRLEPELFPARITRTERPHTIAASMRRYTRRKEWKQTEELSVSHPTRPRLRLRVKREGS